MPRWARFLSCVVTGLLLALPGFLTAAWWREGGPDFWRDLMDFMGTTGFWSLVWLFVLLSALTVLLGRITANLYGVSGGLAGLLAGAVLALAYAAFLVAAHAPEWGGLAGSLQKSWPSAPLFAAPVGLAGAFTGWLWDRLD